MAMALKRQETESDDIWHLTEEEGRELFDRVAQEQLGISGAEFLRRFDAGEYANVPDTPEGWRVWRVEMLMSFVREIPVERA
jgi:hypothetical protein